MVEPLLVAKVQKELCAANSRTVNPVFTAAALGSGAVSASSAPHSGHDTTRGLNSDSGINSSSGSDAIWRIEAMSKGKKSSGFTKDGIGSLAKDKPVVYEILSKNNKNIYTGSAKRGRVEERLKEHLPGGSDPVRGGAKVKIQQKSSINEAQKSEARIIKQDKPPQNKAGK